MTEINSENTEPKQDRRKSLPQLFKPGQSGNPLGKPVGAKNKVSVIGTIESMFERDPVMFLDFVDKYLKDPRNRQHIVEMIDGRPKGSETNVAVQINNYDNSPEEVREGWIKAGLDNKEWADELNKRQSLVN